MNEKNESLLRNAAMRGNTAAVLLILESGVNINAEAHEGFNALANAVYARKLNTVVALLEHGANPNSIRVDDTPLIYRSGKYAVPEIAVALLEHGADINAQKTSNGNTALMQAVINNKVEMVTLLLEHGADLDIQNHDRKTAIDLATEYSARNNHYEEIAEILLNHYRGPVLK